MESIESSLLLRDSTYDAQLAELLSKHGGESNKVCFSKELSIYYQSEKMPKETMAQFQHCFLIRSPAKVMHSFWKVSEKSLDGISSTYFDSDEAGFREIAEIYKVSGCVYRVIVHLSKFHFGLARAGQVRRAKAELLV